MNILFVGAHLDDIELGCGATFIKHKLRGDKVITYLLTNSHYTDINTGYERNLKEIKETQCKLYGDVLYQQEDINPLELFYSTKLAQKIERTIEIHKIDRVYYHSNSDINTDHVSTYQLCKVAARNVRDQLMFSSNWYRDESFFPNIFSLFTEKEYNEWKIDRLKMMGNEWEYRNKRWQNEIFDWERHWGNRLGSDYAEGFIGRVII